MSHPQQASDTVLFTHKVDDDTVLKSQTKYKYWFPIGKAILLIIDWYTPAEGFAIGPGTLFNKEGLPASSFTIED